MNSGKKESRDERKRFGHYVPVEVIKQFDEMAEKYPLFNKQGFFEIVIVAGLKAIENGNFDWTSVGHSWKELSIVRESEGEENAG